MRHLLVALMLATFSLPAFACPMEGKMMDSNEKVQWMTRELDLNKDQQAKVKTIVDAKQAKFKALADQMKALRDETHSEIKAVLTPAQAQKLEAKKESCDGDCGGDCKDCKHGKEGECKDCKHGKGDDHQDHGHNKKDKSK